MRLLRLTFLIALAAAARPAMAEPPARIVSVGGSVTETLYALGEEARIVAVDTTSLFPPEALASHPNVGYLRALSAEGVLSLSPDLIIMEADAGPTDAVALIDAAGVPVVHVPAGHDVDGIAEKIRIIGAAVEREEDAARLADGVAADLAAVEDAVAAVETPRRALFILSLVDGRVMAAGHGTAADAVIGLAGAENVFAEAEGYKTISPEAAAALAPDVILMMDRGDGAGDDPFSLPALAATPAGTAGALVRMDGLYLLGFGPRTAEAVRDLAGRLYPDLALPDLSAGRADER